MVQFHRLWRELFIVVCMCFVAPVSTSAQGGIDIGQRISHLLPSGWNVTAYDFSPNNESIVYSVAGAMGPGELWRWSIPDKTPYLIASGIPTAANSKATPVFAYSLNGRSLVYSAVAPEGSSSIVTGLGVFSLDLGVVQGLITPDFDYYTSIAEFEPSPDGLWVIYTADSEIDEQFELYRVSLVTGQVAKLNLPLKPGGDVLTFAISHDNERLVYAADLAGDDVYQLYSVPLAGEASETKTLSNHEDGPRTVTSDFVITPAGNRVVFVSRLINNYDFTLFSVPIDGETLPVELSASDQEYAGYFDVSPDGETVVFVVNGGIYNGTDIYAVPTLGPANERIWLGQNAGFINYLDVVSNGHHVLWSMPSQQSGVSGLFAASIDGGILIVRSTAGR